LAKTDVRRSELKTNTAGQKRKTDLQADAPGASRNSLGRMLQKKKSVGKTC